MRYACLGAVALAAVFSRSVVADVAYVGNQGNGTVSLIDTATDAVIRTLPDQGSIGAKVLRF